MRYIYENEKSESPRANNETSLRDLYKQKDLYDKSYPNYVFRPRPMKISSKIRSLYGRVDMSGFPIIAKQEFISQLDEISTSLGRLETINVHSPSAIPALL